ncbi:MAG: TIGR04211 family SH3 domain-containing protein [Gammaproteobacteria bacterium]|nr:TIGR04211 family SH3 domain-containing protein [Gammaproteobacteria bacterium]
MKYMTKILFLLAVLPNAGYTQTAYIDDYMRINLRPQPDQASQPIGVVVSGDKLEVLERRDRYVRVRTMDNKLGWVFDKYLNVVPSAKIRLKENENKLAQLREELDRTKQALGQAMSTQAVALSPVSTKTVESKSSSISLLIYWFIVLVLSGTLGFGAGAFYYRHQVERRLGGLRLGPIL